MLLQVACTDKHLVSDVDDAHLVHKQQGFASPATEKLREIAPTQIGLILRLGHCSLLPGEQLAPALDICDVNWLAVNRFGT